MRIRGFGLVVAVVVGLSGCGGESGGVASAGGGSASPQKSVSVEDAQLGFARCMRENGVDVPDPGSGQKALRLGKGGDGEKVQGAFKKCQSWLQAGGKMPDLKDPKARDSYVRFAQCMRENGVDMKDPGPDGVIQVPRGTSPEKVEKARNACRGLLPGSGK
ncbi:hypothetical protein [Actinomadura sp. NEAU-AAG7]|uniref:hypothetical protein n=1 Tax=Actinomadura sp. NEAU-AAG7 TaxID=2839640 RepID=UPI001BE49FFC|nr:hypothetical protein [Actinomadura sp. NEAU-AAG7]MBT2211363.1 hypothetical protein [Actinomadura sp. NEAU-AAG7]